VRRILLTLALTLGLAAPAAAAPKLDSYSVAVRAPAEDGSPVTIDTDAYVPESAAPAKGRPLVLLFHGGGGAKNGGFEVDHAKAFAEHGAVAVSYSARGHGASTGQTTIAGPKEISDLFDVAADAIKRYKVDPDQISLWGYSQGGLHTNLGLVWADDKDLNPTGIRFAAIQPGNTPDRVFWALIDDEEVVKLSFGLALVALYQSSTGGKVAPIVDKWIATAGADVPAAYGAGDVCDTTGHDSTGSSMKADLAARSVGCRADRWTAPVQWMQAFDDALFPVDMALRMWATGKRKAADRLYLSMGGHGAPGPRPEIEREKTEYNVAWLDAVRAGTRVDLPKVVYWLRDPAVAVPYGTPQYPEGAWTRRTASAWPVPGSQSLKLTLSSDGRAVPAGGDATAGDLPLAAGTADPANDPAATAAAQAVPSGTTVTGAAPSEPAPGNVADFRTEPFAADTQLVGSPQINVHWRPATPDSQVVLRVFDEAPDGTLTLLTRGVQGFRSPTAMTGYGVVLPAYAFGALIRKGHRVLARITASDATFYKPYPGMAGGVLGIGADTFLNLPVKADTGPAAKPGCLDRVAPAAPAAPRIRATRRSITASGRSTDTGCGARIARVQVSVARQAGAKCRFLYTGGRTLPARSCKRPVWLLARGTRSWRLQLKGYLKRGTYRIGVRAVDAAQNTGRTRITRVRIR
jgi:ABC-2 type transport system ATP-binding protein